MRSLATDLAGLVAPLECVGCGTGGRAWCPTCDAWLSGAVRRVRPDPEPRGLPPTWAAAPYAGPVPRAVVAYKDRDRTGLAPSLGRALARAVAAAAASTPGLLNPGLLNPVPTHPGLRHPGLRPHGAPAIGRASSVRLVPVPSYPSVARRRGGCHVLRLARVAAADLRRRGVPAEVWPVLEAVRAPRDATALGAAARSRNVHGLFRARVAAAPGSGGVVVLVDDVVTTGATLTAARQALSETWPSGVATDRFGPADGRSATTPAGPSGCPPVVASVVAATLRRQHGSDASVRHLDSNTSAPAPE